MSIEQDGKVGERAFANWLDKESVGYLYINQSPEFFSSIFSSEVKRPDFMVLLPHSGLIAVDVKHYELSNRSFTLNIPKELSKAMEFEPVSRNLVTRKPYL